MCVSHAIKIPKLSLTMNLSEKVTIKPLMKWVSGSLQARATITDPRPPTASSDVNATPMSTESASKEVTKAATPRRTSRKRLYTRRRPVETIAKRDATRDL